MNHATKCVCTPCRAARHGQGRMSWSRHSIGRCPVTFNKAPDLSSAQPVRSKKTLLAGFLCPCAPSQGPGGPATALPGHSPPWPQPSPSPLCQHYKTRLASFQCPCTPPQPYITTALPGHSLSPVPLPALPDLADWLPVPTQCMPCAYHCRASQASPFRQHYDTLLALAALKPSPDAAVALPLCQHYDILLAGFQ